MYGIKSEGLKGISNTILNNKEFMEDAFDELDDLEFESAEILELAYKNTYLIITKEITVQDLFAQSLEKDEIVFLPFDPLEPETISLIIDDVIAYFEEKEEYEKCAKLVEAKKDL